MHITVLSGSPQGEHSSTLQYVRYLEQKNPGLAFQVFRVGRQINRLRRSAGELRQVLDAVSASDAVLWAWPVYCGLVPAQLKTFIELVNDGGHARTFAGKPCTSISTSVHFYDHTAHGYMHAVCEDMGMRVAEGYSAHYEDLLKPDLVPGSRFPVLCSQASSCTASRRKRLMNSMVSSNTFWASQSWPISWPLSSYQMISRIGELTFS